MFIHCSLCFIQQTTIKNNNVRYRKNTFIKHFRLGFTKNKVALNSRLKMFFQNISNSMISYAFLFAKIFKLSHFLGTCDCWPPCKYLYFFILINLITNLRFIKFSIIFELTSFFIKILFLLRTE